jgi:ATP-binding cassette subfamily F protein uup
LRRQLDIADRALAEATAARDAVQAELLAAGGDHQAIARLSEQLATTQSDVDRAEERWLALADEAESIGVEL